MKYNVALIIISTGNYHQFIEPLLNSARVHFLPQDNVTFVIMTDRLKDFGEDCVTVPIKHEPWPGPTLHRYRNIVASKSILSNMDYLFYCDVDMLFVGNVGREILGDGLTATLHPGFYNGGGSWYKNMQSTAYTPIGTKYYAGAVNGGRAASFLAACQHMATNIEIDERAGIVATHNDESHLNCLLSRYPPSVTLMPSYCMVEEPYKRQLWGVDHFPVKIIALAKDHKAIRT